MDTQLFIDSGAVAGLVEISAGRQNETGEKRKLRDKAGGTDPGDVRHLVGVAAQYAFNSLNGIVDPFPVVLENYEDEQGWDLPNTKVPQPIRTYGTPYKNGRLTHRVKHTQPDILYVLATTALFIDGEHKRLNSCWSFKSWFKKAWEEEKKIEFLVRFPGALWGHEMKKLELKRYWEEDWNTPTYAIPQAKLTPFASYAPLLGL